ncbi:hypothetical protein J2Z31_005290 [Sinorhizobium kostiense]|uniref:Uncharacterized protein n=1 Tax=Sinorhizobium kostiense TaxID=76747 RepID=A0ABS4R789_9HYPH|nr:hypothetical protein [Sinorhizobium kostiense]MBP2238749.1 hypothetical protein [Sinorhizobium kostiense]
MALASRSILHGVDHELPKGSAPSGKLGCAETFRSIHDGASPREAEKHARSDEARSVKREFNLEFALGAIRLATLIA